jgi:transcription initiation factor TFIIB
MYKNIWETYETLLSDGKDDDDNNGNIIICTICSSNKIIHDVANGNILCSDCGTVCEENVIDETAEWKTNGGEESSNKVNPSRCGIPINPLLEKSSLSTIIYSHKHVFMKKIHNQLSMNYIERSRYKIFEFIQKICVDRGGFPQVVIEQSKYYYKILSERKLSRGVIRQGLIACCVLYSCKVFNVSRSIKEISQMWDISVPVINKTSKIFLKYMSDVLKTEIPIHKCTSTNDLIPRYCNMINFPRSIEFTIIKKVNALNRIIQDNGILDCKTPSAIVCTLILYVVMFFNVDMTKNNIATKLNISVVTINKILKIIQAHDHLIIQSKDFRNKTLTL